MISLENSAKQASAHWNVVPILGSGCLAFTKEAQSLFPGIGVVAVKRGMMDLAGENCTAEEYEGWNAAAIHLQHRRACKFIRDGAYEALKRFAEKPESFHETIPPRRIHW